MYLEYLLSVMKRKKIDAPTIIGKEGIGVAFLGDEDGPIIRKGGFSKEYDNALISII